ncbi:hypothetical protein LJR234_006796 [Mesorhizobium amorphae]|uniref:hypothetical protein n=1 Tax=Mesorhizobium amorphae TaxID=71433 RepID=UPI003ECE6207
MAKDSRSRFFRSAMESCAFEIVTPSRPISSSAKLVSVKLTRFVTGADISGATTRTRNGVRHRGRWSG